MPGFLGTRGTLMLDLVVVAMAVTLPLMLGSVYVVRTQETLPSAQAASAGTICRLAGHDLGF